MPFGYQIDTGHDIQRKLAFSAHSPEMSIHVLINLVFQEVIPVRCLDAELLHDNEMTDCTIQCMSMQKKALQRSADLFPGRCVQDFMYGTHACILMKCLRGSMGMNCARTDRGHTII